jgi:hypothetical protein
MVTDGHLGGYLPGGDPDTYYPAMWDWLIDTWEVASVVDVGCGDGLGSLAHFANRLGWENVVGVEGMDTTESSMTGLIYRHDYTTGPFDPRREFDLGWSAEFLEHVEESFVPNFMATFRCCRFVCVTHGEPGQPGHHHVNNQPGDYWKGAFAANGFEFDEGLTAMTKAAAAANGSVFNHYRRSGLAFRRRSS